MASGIHTLIGTSLRNRAMVANALCALAEEEIHAGEDQRALDTVRTIRGVLREVGLLLEGDVSYLPSGDLREASGLLVGVESRIGSMEKLMGPHLV